MSEIDNDVGFLSLLDLANTSTDDIATVLSRLPAAGIYTVKGDSVSGKQGEPKDDKPGLISYTFGVEILDAKLVDKKLDAQSLVGRKLRDSYTLWPNQLEELIGLLKGRYQKVGLANGGPMGGVEGAAPGWLDGMVGHIFQLRVYTFQSKGQTRAGFDWIGPVQEEENPAPAAAAGEAEKATA